MGEGPELHLRTLVASRKTPAGPCLPIFAIDASSRLRIAIPAGSSNVADAASRFSSAERAIGATGTAGRCAHAKLVPTPFDGLGPGISARRQAGSTTRHASKPTWHAETRR